MPQSVASESSNAFADAQHGYQFVLVWLCELGPRVDVDRPAPYIGKVRDRMDASSARVKKVWDAYIVR
jgi:hypothetical protein